MKAFWNIFKNSLKLPQRQAAFALNRIGMDIVILYMFLLLAIASIPGLVEQIQANDNATGVHIQTFFWLIFFFIFYYLVMVTILFAYLSFIAYIGSLIAKATRRKLRYSILWKMTACITTIPALIFTIISFFYAVNSLYLAAAFLFHFIIFIQTIFLYPKKRHVNKKK